MLEGLRGEESIAELCRREGIIQNLYYRWSKDFLEAGKKRLAGDTARAATSDEVKDLRREASTLKEVVAELTLENCLFKKNMIADGGTRHEIARVRESRGHSAGRAIAPAGQAHAGEARHPKGHVLPLVRSLSRRRAGGSGGSLASSRSRLEPHISKLVEGHDHLLSNSSFAPILLKNSNYGVPQKFVQPTL